MTPWAAAGRPAALPSVIINYTWQDDPSDDATRRKCLMRPLGGSARATQGNGIQAEGTGRGRRVPPWRHGRQGTRRMDAGASQRLRPHAGAWGREQNRDAGHSPTWRGHYGDRTRRPAYKLATRRSQLLVFSSACSLALEASPWLALRASRPAVSSHASRITNHASPARWNRSD